MRNPDARASVVWDQNPQAPAPPVHTVFTLGRMLFAMGVGCFIVGVIFAAALPKSESTDGVVGGLISLSFMFFVAALCRWCGWYGCCRPHTTNTTIVNNYGSVPRPDVPTAMKMGFVNTSSVYV